MRRKPYYDAFYSQRYSALKVRRIEWLLTFEEWLKTWVDSGHLEERGRGRGKYCMSRPGDTGPYAIGNIKIIKYEENVSEGCKGIPKSEIHKQRISKGLVGVPKTPEHIAKNSAAQKGKIPSAETIRKRSIAMKGRPSPRKGKTYPKHKEASAE